MTTAPGLPHNPTILCCDTSALLQLSLADSLIVLRELKQHYGIHSAIVDAVHAEMMYRLSRDFKAASPSFTHAIRNHTIERLDESLIDSAGYKAADSLFEAMQNLGDAYYVRIDRGEAYTHAAANTLGVPTLSHDIRALLKLRDAGIRVERPILRCFDILLFGVQIGCVDFPHCNRARKTLRAASEAVPEAFANSSVEDGLPNYYVRILDRARTELGAQRPIGDFDQRLYVDRKP